MKTFPRPLTASEERGYLERYGGGNQEARNVSIEQDMRLVAHVAKKYQYTDYDNKDLLSVDTVGLIKAANMFNVDRGSRLVTYAARCVEDETLMLLRAHKKYSREVSLFEPIGVDKGGETVSLVDMVGMDNKEILESLIIGQDVKEPCKASEVYLEGDERTVVGTRYGLFGSKKCTQREIADMFDISRFYVSRTEKKAVEKLRTESEWCR